MFLPTLISQTNLQSGQQGQWQNTFGQVNPPQGVAAYNTAAGGLGLLLFISNIIKLASVIAGIWVMVNFILSGWDYITSSGDSGAHKKVTDRLTMSVIGLILIVTAYTIIGLISYVVFGNAGYILNPTIQGPTP